MIIDIDKQTLLDERQLALLEMQLMKSIPNSQLVMYLTHRLVSLIVNGQTLKQWDVTGITDFSGVEFDLVTAGN